VSDDQPVVSLAAVPDETYLARIGEVAYRVSQLEWFVIGDPFANHPLIDTLGLLGKTTGQIAAAFAETAAALDDRDPQGHFLTVAATALRDVGSMRNHILHARPGIAPGGGRPLLRLRVDKRGDPEFFWIDAAYLDKALARIAYWTRRVERASGHPTH